MNPQALNGVVGASFAGKLIVPILVVFSIVTWSAEQVTAVYAALTGLDVILLAYGVKLRRALDE